MCVLQLVCVILLVLVSRYLNGTQRNNVPDCRQEALIHPVYGESNCMVPCVIKCSKALQALALSEAVS